jgi:hypothetical protein
VDGQEASEAFSDQNWTLTITSRVEAVEGREGGREGRRIKNRIGERERA